jgi:hypothetical protein
LRSAALDARQVALSFAGIGIPGFAAWSGVYRPVSWQHQVWPANHGASQRIEKDDFGHLDQGTGGSTVVLQAPTRFPGFLWESRCLPP